MTWLAICFVFYLVGGIAYICVDIARGAKGSFRTYEVFDGPCYAWVSLIGDSCGWILLILPTHRDKV